MMEILVNGRRFELWETATLTRSIDTNIGAFRFTNSSTVPGKPYPVKVGDYIYIVVNGERRLTGYVDEISLSSDENSHIITVSGRDVLADLVDSSVPDSVKVNEGTITLKKLCENMLNALNMAPFVNEEIRNVLPFTAEEIQAAQSGGNAMEFLLSFARKRQVYLVSNNISDLVIYRPVNDQSSTPLTRIVGGLVNNVKSSMMRIANQTRFNKIICKSADNAAASFDYFGDGQDRNGTAEDEEIRGSRFLEIQGEESMTDVECVNRAKEEVNLRRARSKEYVAVVAGLAQNDGTVWDYGQFVDVNDEYANVQGKMLIRTVQLNVDIRSGSRTTLTCSQPDAFQVVDVIPPKDKRLSTMGEDIA